MERKFTKKALINSQRFAEYRDLLTVILKDKEYTLAQVEKAIAKALKQEVH